MFESLGKLVLYLLGDSTSYTKMLKDAQLQFKSTTKAIATAGVTLALSVVKPLVEIGTSSVIAAASFERSMGKIVGLVGIAKKTVEGWSKELLSIGPKFGKDANELSAGMYFITSAGFKGADAMDVLKTSSMGAAAGLGSVKEVAFAAVSALNAYKYAGYTAVQAIDMITAAAREGHMEAADLARVIGNTLPLAAAMKLPLSDLLAGVASLTKLGASPSQAIIGIQGILKNFLKPTVAARKALEGVGLTFEQLRDMIKKPGGILEALKLLSDAMDKEGDIGGGVADIFGEIRPLRAALSLLVQDAGAVKHIFDAVANSGGATQAAFDAIASTASFKFEQMVSQIKSTAITLGSVLSPAITPFLEGIKKAFEGVVNWIEEMKKVEQIKVLFTGIGNWFSDLWKGISTIARKAWNEIMESLGTDWNTLQNEWKEGIALLSVLIYSIDVQRIINGIQDLINVTKTYVKENSTAIMKVLALATALYVLYEGVLLLSAGYALLTSTLAFLRVQLILKIALLTMLRVATITYHTTLVAISATLLALTVVAITINAVIRSVNVLMIAHRLIVLGITAATWLYNASLIAGGVVFTAFQLILTGATATLAFWKAALVMATGVYAVLQAALASGTITTLIWSIATNIATASTWLFNAALTVMNLLLSPTALLAAAITIGVIATALVVAAATGWGVWKALSSLYNVLEDFPTTFGPIAHISGLFKEWFGIIKDVIKAAQTDLPLAWAIMSKGFELAVSQMKDLFPPLWNFIQQGFEILWQLVSEQFKLGMVGALLHVLMKGNPIFKALFGDTVKQWQDDITKGMDFNIVVAKAKLKEAAEGFSVVESEETKKTRKELEKLRNSIPSGKGRIGDAWSEDLDKIPGLAKATAGAWNKTIKDNIKPLDAVLFGSAEARSRINDFMNMLKQGGALPNRAVQPNPRARERIAPKINDKQRVAAGYDTNNDKGNELLEKILVVLQQSNKNKGKIDVLPLDLA